MKYVLIVAGAIAGFIALSLPAFSSTVVPQPRAQRESTRNQLTSDTALEELSHFKQLENHIDEALHAWEPDSVLQEAVAHDIVRVVLDPTEPALFSGDSNKSRTAILMAAIETHEGHGFSYVDSGLCNDPKEKLNPLLLNGNCDSGEAVSLWQIHPGRGIVLFDNGLYGYRALGSTIDDGRVATAARLHDRLFAAKVALHMLRTSLKRDGTLCEYTGETKPCPKAIKRLKFAIEWSKAHPL